MTTPELEASTMPTTARLQKATAPSVLPTIHPTTPMMLNINTQIRVIRSSSFKSRPQWHSNIPLGWDPRCDDKATADLLHQGTFHRLAIGSKNSPDELKVPASERNLKSLSRI